MDRKQENFVKEKKRIVIINVGARAILMKSEI